MNNTETQVYPCIYVHLMYVCICQKSANYYLFFFIFHTNKSVSSLHKLQAWMLFTKSGDSFKEHVITLLYMYKWEHGIF